MAWIKYFQIIWKKGWQLLPLMITKRSSLS
jgi:hypothetical protein